MNILDEARKIINEAIKKSQEPESQEIEVGQLVYISNGGHVSLLVVRKLRIYPTCTMAYCTGGTNMGGWFDVKFLKPWYIGL